MKHKILIAIALLASLPVMAQNLVGNFTAGGLNYGAGTTNYAIIGQSPVQLPTASGANTPLRAVVKYLSATSDALASTTTGAGNVVWYHATNSVTYVTNSTATTNVISYNGSTGIGSSNGLGANTEVVIQHVSVKPNTYELAYVSAVSAPITGGTNLFTNWNGTVITNLMATLTLAVVPTNTTQVGDIVWMMATNGTGKQPVGVATLNIGPGDGIYVGDPNEPLLAIIRGGTNASINAITAGFAP